MTPDDLNAAAARMAAQLDTQVRAIHGYSTLEHTAPEPLDAYQVVRDAQALLERVDAEEKARQARGPHRVLCPTGTAVHLRAERDRHHSMDAHDVAFREHWVVPHGQAWILPPDGTRARDWEDGLTDTDRQLDVTDPQVIRLDGRLGRSA